MNNEKLVGTITSESLQINAKINTVTINGVLQAGARGKSSYELWLEQGNTGTVEEFLSSIGADKTEIYNQQIPSTEWLITHNLGKYPSVTIVDSGDSVVYGEIEYLSNNQVRLSFTAAFAGKAYLN